MTLPASAHLYHLRFRQLQLVLALERGGSLRSAASELHQSASALSKSLQEIESALGQKLFDRTGRGLKLTERGRLVARGAAVLLAELDHLGVELALASDRVQAVVRVGMLPYLTPWLAPRLFGALKSQHPDVLLRLREERVPILLEQLLSGELDALVTTYTVETALDPARAGLRYRILLEEKFVAVAAPSYLAKGARATSWRALASHDWILPERFTFLRRQVEEAFLRDGATPPAPVIESNNAATNVKLAAAGHGITVVPERILNETVSPRDVRMLALEPLLEPTRVALVYRATMEQHRRIGVLQQALALCLPQGASGTSQTPAISRSRASARAPGKS